FSEPAGATDHSLVVRDFGLRLAADVAAPAPLVMIGGRYWLTDRFGIDPAIGFRVQKTEDVPMQFNIGLGIGVPILISQFKHICFYIEPALDFEFWHAPEKNNQWAIGLQGLFVGELSFGWIGVPRLAMTAGLGLALRVFNNGSVNDFTLGTATAGVLGNLLTANAGVIYYF
ncbi:MAG: hypothetical protein FJ087_19780, partial [Deltaproteobacteria bacterium]|nr:hypothetical protein [Deltaproteobacteria bacterium]